ncbi:MAG: hypothetical protein ACI4M9_09020 [Succinivibrio sp.]
MLLIKNYAVVAITGLVLGFFGGYLFSDAKAERDKLNFQLTALKAENTNLIKQLEVENERHNQTQITVAETQKDLADLEMRYSNAINELNLLQLQSDTSSSNRATLSSDADSSSTVSESRCECSFKDREKFQRLYEKQLTIARDCDITTIHYNQLINLYNGIK